MLHLQVFTFNPFSENTYLIYNDNQECWIVDPGMINEQECQELFSFIESHQLQPQAIINTHAHIDHILGVDVVAQRYNIPFYLHELEMPVLNNAANTARMFGFEYAGVQTKPGFLSEQHLLRLGNDPVTVLLVPGHSPGSIAFYYEKGDWVISGDALFAGSIGRTDLLLGDHPTLIHSIKTQLLPLPAQTAVHSGHGPSTTIGQELNSNPFLN
ncbi:MBL fold metallo-hydrolase [Rurimicrobium arvi]|uniref:MBL fold metallo-hydrolase n=1 Tax=Rurimicrobium arvi TaxID=2049916 RepID=A0ABP8MPM2_9BACT